MPRVLQDQKLRAIARAPATRPVERKTRACSPQWSFRQRESAYFPVEANLFRDESRTLDPPEGFDEAEYVAANPDVKQAVVFGRFDSGFHHWLHYGRNEKRAYSPQKS